MDRMLARWAPLVGVGLLLAAAWVAAALSSPQVTNLSVAALESRSPAVERSVAPNASPPPSIAADDAGAGAIAVPGWMTTLAAVLCAIVALAVLGAFGWYLIRDRIGLRKAPLLTGRPGGQPLPGGSDVVAAVDAGLSDLSQADADPRRAIIACWVRLEQVAAAAGTPRRTSDSPTDLVARLLNTRRVSPAVLDGFAGVYREARYATHPMDEHMRHAAIAALAQLRTELAPVAVPAEVPR